jgi:plastocyanin
MRDPLEIHTVSFQQGGQTPKPLSEVVVQPQKQGAPKLSWNPLVIQRTEGKTYDGMGYANSGLLFTKGLGPPNAPDSFSLTFTKPGRYTYFCWVHTIEAMRGAVIVRSPPAACRGRLDHASWTCAHCAGRR